MNSKLKACAKKDRPGLVFVCRQISSDANRTQFNRLQFLCDNYSVFIVSLGMVSMDAGKKAEKISVFSENRCLFRALFPIWVMWTAFRHVRTHSNLNCIYSTYEPGTLLLSFIISKLLKMKWIADLWDDPQKFVFNSRINPVRFQHLNVLIKKIEYLLATSILKYADKIIIGVLPQKIIFEFNIEGSRVLSVTNGLNFNCQFPDIEKKWPGPDQELVVFYCGTTDPVRLEGIKQCFTHVLKHVPYLRLVVAGYQIGDGYAWLKKQIKDVDLRMTLEIVGIQPYETILNLIGQSDICICPYPDKLDLGGAYPVKLFDYMIMGKPIVASRLPGIASILTNGEDAFLFEPGDYEKMAECIIRLYEAESLRMGLSSNAKKNAGKFAWRQIHQKINNFIAPLLSNEPVRFCK